MFFVFLAIYLVGLIPASYLVPRFVRDADEFSFILMYPVLPVLVLMRYLADLGDEHRGQWLRKKTGRGW